MALFKHSPWFSPVTTHIANRLIDRDERRRHALAMRDPRFSEIEYRQTDAHQKAWSSRDDLEQMLFDREAQQFILYSIPSSPWIPACYWVAGHPGRRAAVAVVHGTQRLRRGWDDKALWSLDIHLCATLAEQLEALADTTNGWPDGLFVSFESWQDALRSNAASLAAYATRSSSSAFDHWDAVLIDPSASPQVREEAMRAALAQEAAVTREAQQALRWVADVLPHLWD